MTRQQKIEYEKRISELEEALYQSESRRKDQEKIVHAVRHDMGTLEGALGLLNPQKWTGRSEENRNRIVPVIYKSIEKALGARDLLYLPGMSKERLYKSSENIDVMELARLYASSIDYYLEENEITLQIKSDEKMGGPIKIYANRSALGLVFGNILGGFVNHALPGSIAKIGIGEYNGVFSIRGENKFEGTERLRSITGEGEGIGLSFIEDFAKTLEGTLELYSVPRIGSAPLCATSGYRGKLKKHSKANTFGVEISIPTESLIEILE